MIRAALIRAVGEPPELGEIDSPAGEGDVVVDVSAFALNPIDVNVALGRFYGGTPPLPYVAGVEAVGTDEDGRRVYVNGAGIGIARDGVWAERIAVPETAVHPVPDGADDAVAVACGVAGLAGWMPVTRVADVKADDRVLVLGATSTVGRVAVQAAKLRGAQRVVGAGRRRELLDRVRKEGADEVVELTGDDPTDAFAAAFGDERPTVVIDALWGAPLVAALGAAATGVRVVQIGQSAGAEATIPSNFVRGRGATVYGYSNYRVPRDVFEEAYRELVEHASTGRVDVGPLEEYPFARLVEAWERQAAGPGAKLVVRF